MIYFNHLALSDNIMQALEELNIDYVFQPIFENDGKTIYAYEALMRPHDMTVTELIEKYQKENKLHVLEVATFFGATQAFILRGYHNKISVNSFPSESMLEEEINTYLDYYGKDFLGKLVVEMLEYPSFSLKHGIEKREDIRELKHVLALDDYGTGINDAHMVKIMEPDIIKLDRTLISDIDKNIKKQENCKNLIKQFHRDNIKVVAEGVETKEEFDYLLSIDADLFQGYYLARPE